MGSRESSLEYYNTFLSGLKVGLNETENVKGLYTILPTECLSTLEQLKFRKATMPEVFSTLQTIHGSRKTLDELQSSIEIGSRLTSDFNFDSNQDVKHHGYT